MTESDSIATQRRLFFVIVGAYAVVYLVLFFFGVFTFPVKYFLPTFRPSWTLSESLLRFMAVVVAVQCSAILIVYAFSPDYGIDEGFAKSGGATLVLFLLMTVVFAVLVEGAEPRARRALEERRNQTLVARTFLERAQEAFEDGRYRESQGLLEYYRSVDPGNRDAAELYGMITSRLAAEISNTARDRVDAPPVRARLPEQSPAELIALAQRYLDDEDPFSAYYYARLAMDSAAQRRETWQQAERISAIAAQTIDALELTEAELEEADLYATKQRGIESLSSSDPEMIVQGYYIFEDLYARYPRDVEAIRYLNEATGKIANVSFFIDEAEEIRPVPGIRNVVFVNRSTSTSSVPTAVSSDDIDAEIVSLGKVVETSNGVFVERVEVIRIDPAGEVKTRYTATLGELLGSVLILRGIDRSDPAISIGPTYLTRNEEGLQLISDTVLPIHPSFDELALLQVDVDTTKRTGFFGLVAMSEVLPTYGHNPIAARAEALDRIVSPFSFFVLSVLSAGLGMRLRPRRGRPPIAPMVFLPLVPIVTFGAVQIYQYGISVLTAWLLYSVRFDIALLLTIAAQLVLIVLAVIYLATHRSPSNER